MVGEIAKAIGNKKPLSDLTAKAVKSKGAVLMTILLNRHN